MTETRDPRLRWAEAEAGGAYASTRWSSAARSTRDPRRIERLLRRHVERAASQRLLDVPCGAGRLQPMLAQHGHYVGLDVSRPMLGACTTPGALVQGAIEELPFVERSFDIVVCCRLLHHLADGARLDRAVRELVRVSSDWIVVTFWDSGSLPALRRRVFPRRRASGRVARKRSRIQAALEAAGATVVEWDASLRYVSRQTYGIARRR